jgi:hypothetical protein
VVDASLSEQVLVDLALWLSRVQQYSAAHPVCAQLGDRMHATLVRALASASPISYGVLKDEVTMEGATLRHPVIRTKIAPHLHNRGVLLMRFAHGVTVDELSRLIELLILPEQTIFDRGGLARLATEQNVVRIQIEELAHDISLEERDARRRRDKFRTSLRDLLRSTLARRRPDGTLAEHIVELLEHPDIAVTILEEDALGIAEAAAGLALIARQEQDRTGPDAAFKVARILLALAASSRVRLLLGLPSLAGDFRSALAWVLDAMTEAELARLTLPAVRAHAHNLEPVLYALSTAVQHDGTRYSALRRISAALFDLGADDTMSAEVMSALVAPIPPHDSFRRERQCLAEHAPRALARRTAKRPTVETEEFPAFDAARSIADVIEIGSRTRSFERLCHRLANVIPSMGRDGALGALHGLSIVATTHASPDARRVAERSRVDVARSIAPAILADLDGESVTEDERTLARIAASVKLFAREAAEAVLDRLDISESRNFRRIALDALEGAPMTILPLVRARLRSPKWYVVRNAVILIARTGGNAGDLLPIATHPREQVRSEIIRAIKGMQDPAAMTIVARFLTDSAPEIATAAPPMLRGELCGADAVSLLEAIAADDHRGEELRRRVIYALGRCPRDEAAQALLRILQPKGLVDLGGSTVRDSAALALRHSQAPAARDCFDQGLRSSVWRVRKACERAMDRK